MSTNDEIRKAVALALATNHGEPEEACSPGYLGDAAAAIHALAPYLAPHPAQKGEDSTKAILPIYDREGEAMGDGDSFVYQHGSPHEQIITIERTGGVEYLSFSSGQPRMTVADFWYARSDEKQSVKCARSHSKQEGGA